MRIWQFDLQCINIQDNCQGGTPKWTLRCCVVTTVVSAFFKNFSCYASDMNVSDIHYNHLLVRVEKNLVLIQKDTVITCESTGLLSQIIYRPLIGEYSTFHESLENIRCWGTEGEWALRNRKKYELGFGKRCSSVTSLTWHANAGWFANLFTFGEFATLASARATTLAMFFLDTRGKVL